MVQTERAMVKTLFCGRPQAIRVDNGPEFISKDLDLWAYFAKVRLDFSRPGKPGSSQACRDGLP
jgi:transposase InsO family protein